MPKCRWVTPQDFSSIPLSEISIGAHLTFIGLWCFADDHGFILNIPKRIIGDIYPLRDEVTEKMLSGWISELVRVGLLVEFDYKGRSVLYVNEWKKHQKIRHICPSFIIEMDEINEVIKDITGNLPETYRKLTDRVEEDCVSVSVSLSESVSDTARPPARGDAGDPEKEIHSTFKIQGGKTWSLTVEKFNSFSGSFPSLDVVSEFRRAASWLESNAGKRKTGRGMPRFLNAWLDRSANNGKDQDFTPVAVLSFAEWKKQKLGIPDSTTWDPERKLYASGEMDNKAAYEIWKTEMEIQGGYEKR